MRVLLTASLLAASLQSALAQSTGFPESGSPERTSIMSSWASSESSLSSKIGPYYTTYMFAPGVIEYGYVTAVGSGGPDDPAAETTTYQAYMTNAIEDEWTGDDWKASDWEYANYTVGPTTYVQSRSWTEELITFEHETTVTFSAHELTTRCSYSVIKPKIPLPDEVWKTIEWSMLQLDNYNTHTAVCSTNGWESLSGTVSNVNQAYTLTYDTTVGTDSSGLPVDTLWRILTVIGESPSGALTTDTLSGKAGKQTGSVGAAQAGSGSGTEGAKATSTQAAGASEVTAWVNAVVVVAAAAAIAI